MYIYVYIYMYIYMYIYNDYNGWSFITSEIPNFILPYFFPIPIILIRIADLVTPHQTVPRCSEMSRGIGHSRSGGTGSLRLAGCGSEAPKCSVPWPVAGPRNPRNLRNGLEMTMNNHQVWGFMMVYIWFIYGLYTWFMLFLTMIWGWYRRWTNYSNPYS